MPKVNMCIRLTESVKKRIEKIAKKTRHTPSFVTGTILENMKQSDMERIFNRDRTLEG